MENFLNNHYLVDFMRNKGGWVSHFKVVLTEAPLCIATPLPSGYCEPPILELHKNQVGV